jgi:hypothetical protein
LIEFTIWSSVGHMLGDVPALLLVAVVLGGLTYAGGARSATG